MDGRQLLAIESYREGVNGWEQRGNALHDVLEKMLIGSTMPGGIDSARGYERFQDWIIELQNCEIFQDAKVLASEYGLCDEEKSIGGSFDFLIKTAKGETILGDLKTTSSLKAAKGRKPATEQLGAYATMLEHHHPTIKIDKCCTLVLGPKICRPIDQEPEKCKKAWADIWEDFEGLDREYGLDF